MIRRTASAVFLLRDGFTGVTLTDGASRCWLDGSPLSRPLWKREGYLVLTDLAPGEHTLVIRRRQYREETVLFRTEEGKTLEDTLALKPGTGYPFPRETVRVRLCLRWGDAPAAGASLWLGVPLRVKLRLAQEKAEAGAREVHLFCEGGVSRLPIPGHFLLADKAAPELAYLQGLHGENGRFSPALALPHGRGTELIPMQAYTADGDGTVQILLSAPGTLTGFFGGTVFSAELRPGEQTLEWKLEG